MTVKDYTRTIQEQGNPNLSMEPAGGGGGHKVPALAEKLLAFDSCWVRNIFFFFSGNHT